MALRIREASGVSIIDIDGNVDVNSSEIVETVGWLINSGKLNIIIDMENADTVDYSGLSVLAIAYKNVTNHNGKLKFLHVSLPVIELFKVVRLDHVFEVHSDEKEAVESFSKSNACTMPLRRKFKRIDLHLKVTYRPKGQDASAEPLEGNALNISAAGVYIFTHDTLPVGTFVKLSFELPDNHVGLEPHGCVVYMADKQLQPHIFPGMGVAFIHLTNEQELTIINYIDKNLTFRSD